MCGRFAFDIEKPVFIRRFNTQQMEITLEPHYNVSPGMFLPAIIRKSTKRVLLMKWGLIPHWSKKFTVPFSTINARAETIETSPSYRHPFATQRCLIPSIGFYEWAKLSDGTKNPYFFTLKDSAPFAFAGIWDAWKDIEGKEFLTCAIVTCPANKVVGAIHPRMPVILNETDENAWLDTREPLSKIKTLLAPYDENKMEGCRVSTRVNNPQNDDRHLIDQFNEQ